MREAVVSFVGGVLVVFFILLALAATEARADYVAYYSHGAASTAGACQPAGSMHPAWTGQGKDASCADTVAFFTASKGCLGAVTLNSCTYSGTGAFVSVSHVHGTDSGTTAGSCPYGGTLTNVGGVAMCVSPPACPAGQTRNPTTGVCETVDPCAAGSGTTDTYSLFMGWQLKPGGDVQGGQWNTVITDPNATWSIDGCRWKIDPNAPVVSCYFYPDAPTKKYCDFKFVAVGVSDSSSPSVDIVSSSDPCPANYTFQTVNGIGNCMQDPSAPGGVDPNKPGDPTQIPGTSTTSTTSNTVTNGDGSTTTTTTVTNNNTTSTTVTNRNAAGQVTSQTTTTNSTGADKSGAGSTDQAQYCRDNPKAPQCREASFSGSCGAYVCEGDAVLCAIAKQQHEYACQFDASTEATTYRDAQTGTTMPTAADAAKAANKDGTHDMDVQSLFNSNTGKITQYGDACPAPITVPLPWGGSVQVSFDILCGLADILKPFVMLGALMLAFAIVFKSKES